MKFVSLSQLSGCQLFASNSGLFTVPGFIVSLVGIKKKKDRRKKRYKNNNEMSDVRIMKKNNTNIQ